MNFLIERVKSAMVGLGTGWILVLMLVLSIISLAIMLERAWLYWSLRDDIEALMRDLGRLLRGGDLEGARQRLEASRSAEAAVVVAGLVEADHGVDAAQEAMDGASALQAPVVVGDGLSGIELEVADGGEGIEDDIAVLLVGVLLVGREDAELAGESVAIGVESATALAFGSLGAGGTVGGRSQVGLLIGHRFLLHNKNGPLSAASHAEGGWRS